MDKKISQEEIRKILSCVKHPVIDKTLLDLGIIKSITVENDNVLILLAFPFLNIPIKDQLINSIREPLNKRGLEVNFEITVMNKEELQDFLAMEQKSWKGKMT